MTSTDTLYDRARDEGEALVPIIDRLRDAAGNAGYNNGSPRRYEFGPIDEAIAFTAIQCDFEADDYETLEATMFARLEDADKTGER
jgi:hypothetical protein